MVQAEDPKTVDKATQVIHKTLTLTMKACRCTTNGTLGHYTSGALAFKRDMLMNIPLVLDIIALQNKRQELINKQLHKAKASQISHHFKVDKEILKKCHLSLSDKLQPSLEGPYQIKRVHTNGTITINTSPHTTEHINVCRIKPYYHCQSS